MRRGETAAALGQVEHCLQRFPSEKTEWHWRCRVLKAELLHQQGFEKEALALAQPELPVSMATSETSVRRRLLQGTASAFMQKLPEADKYLAEAEDLIKANHPELSGELALRRGTYFFFKGETELAGTAYQKALHAARQQNDRFLETGALGGLGLVATKEGHYDKSIDWNRAALELSRTIGARASLTNTLGNMGWSYAELGDFENALTYYKQAEEASVRSGLLSARVYWLTSIAYAHQGLHDDGAAETILKQALPLARAYDSKETLAQCLTQLSWIALRTKRNDLAASYSQEASDLEGQGLGPRLVIETRLLRGLIASKRRNYAEAEKSLQEVIREPRAIKFQQWTGQAELAKVYADEGLSAKAEKEFRRSLETIEGVRTSLQTEELRLSFLFNTIAFFNDYVEFLISHHRIKDALQVAELSHARTLAEGLGAAHKTLSFALPDIYPERIAQRSNAILLFYWLAPKNSYLWVIAPHRTALLRLPPDSEIDPLIKSYRKEVLGMRDAQDPGNSDGEKLYAMLVEPAKKLIPPGSRVILLPESNLFGLNFETLIVPDPQPHFWIEDVTITTASSLTLLDASIRRPATIGKDLLLIGNTEQASPDFPTLAQAPAEMNTIERYFPEPRRKVLEGKQATPAAYLGSNPQQYSYLHFVTHGTASRTRPLESAVILSKEPFSGTYKLYARDIVQHRLNANLVTISACNGSGTRAYSGEGLVGLSWAFLRAGAHNVIGALWEVSDASTPQLMDALYSELSQGKDPATALRNAKLSLLHSPDPESVFRKPFYWAPFQLYAGS
jgi:CHAT domain-containing protein/tetratricopeptide (TPR) repeat protein